MPLKTGSFPGLTAVSSSVVLTQEEALATNGFVPKYQPTETFSINQVGLSSPYVMRYSSL
jgi:hypothetical protein